MNNLNSLSGPVKDYINNFLQTKDLKSMLTKDNSNYIINVIIIAVGLYFLFYTIDAFFKIQYIVILAVFAAYWLRKNNIYFYKK